MSGRCRLTTPGETAGLPGLLMARRSVRSYGAGSPTVPDLGRLLWAGQGVSHSSGKRTAPSPRSLCPLTLFLVAAGVADIEAGLYAYEPRAHALDTLGLGDLRIDLYRACLEDQPWVRDCAALIVVAGDIDQSVNKFASQPPDGKRGRRYVYMETGAVAQNIALQAAELGLGTVLVAGFDDVRVQQCLGIDLAPLAMMPLGRLPD